MNIADNYSVKSDFEQFISKFKKTDIVKAKFKYRRELDNGTYLLIFRVGSLDCALASYKIGPGSQLEVDKLENGDFLDLKIEGIDLEKNRVFLSTPDYKILATKKEFKPNNINGLSIKQKFNGKIIGVSDFRYVIRLKDDLVGYLNKNKVKTNLNLNVNDIVYVRISFIDYQNKKVYLKF